ncbi:MAG: hypothetical protein KAQ70_07780, partial [Candidatus Heimdallarchaeota archaeon]|nr:hypothetical protein [Candidatus Heimdallarchaeota archaeon]
NGIATITTANITVSVNAPGNVPTLHFKTVSGLEYNVMFKQLLEYEDLNEDGAFQYNETIEGVPMVSLTSLQWLFSGFVTDEVEGEIQAIHFNFTSDEVVGMVSPDLVVNLAMHLYLEDQIIDGYELLGGAEFKFDLFISGWEWANNDTLLALRFDITPGEGYEIKNQNIQTVDTTINTTNEEEKVAQVADQIKQRFNIENNENGAFFGYANQSRIMKEEQLSYGSVNASISTTGDGSMQLFLSFEQFDELHYDPSLGTDDSGDSSDGVPISWITFITLPIVAVAALLVSKQSKKK